ncbi:MAG: hypothetical protein A3H57_03510 [Candidatus Taylorbacteria bacterium RIFCSPLOWO2_02_FULL_43_11]|uniref:RNA polymerase sigma factor n=1 Tax=Candidatus Taylorbacteria bacterium RIFCSPHIGHO2_02_FULL_43_32b TaxID=1802306 RepID=A0A1G2MKJ3_9BACT|nr:MAG: hypothetical protein A3C72_02165 [Candidatus Taylorbacteria bacterium RIFCSPHIGHO2_02_FULL_43_32b]OHA31702.1 MAG: hypothetical protein A3B08_01890 [Candidatus Taylorbacteria bacterium RIFCSPLOWO2_01_FULL_43_44]OHA36616.1 MAG: hypothetical protein A3H57_03510 [Candidatus Taylorbacteria bacterium RIFCSPLOWO2_02_FULL_43_11]
MTRNKEQEKAFLEAYDTYADVIFRHSLMRLSDRDEAKDVTQETFLRYWKYVSTEGEAVRNVRAFLYHVANNLIIDHWRKKKAESLDDLLEAGFQVAEREEENTDFEVEAANVILLFKTFPDRERDTLVLRYVDDLSVKKIAELMGESENAVSVRIHRALKKLKEKLKG